MGKAPLSREHVTELWAAIKGILIRSWNYKRKSTESRSSLPAANNDELDKEEKENAKIVKGTLKIHQIR